MPGLRISVVVALVFAVTATVGLGGARADTYVGQPSPYSGRIDGTSCSSSTHCVSVGVDVDLSRSTPPRGEVAEVIIWDGVRQTRAITPKPAGATATRLLGVSCPTTLTCLAVGYWTDSGGRHPLLERSTDGGTTWTLQTSPTYSEPLTLFNRVKCVSPTSCVAVGWSSGGSVDVARIIAWNGSTWSNQPVPLPTGSTGSRLYGVSCVAAGSCMAVGYFNNASGNARPLVMYLAAGSWTLGQAPFADPGPPVYAPWAVMRGVACVGSLTKCWAVGGYLDNNNQHQYLIYYWEGSHWNLQYAPAPGGVLDATFLDVSCNTAGGCAASGYYQSTSSNYAPVLSTYAGAGWNPAVLPSVSSSLSILNSVSCPEAGYCLAGGLYYDTQERSESLSLQPASTGAPPWAPWSSQQVPWYASATTTNGRIDGVSCLSGTSCVSVGSTVNDYGQPQAPSTQIWSGSTWSVRLPPLPAGVTGPSYLNGVSCAGTGCTAVGLVSTSTNLPLVERWNGTSWTLQSAPLPSGFTFGSMSEVSCATSTFCVATGNGVNPTNNPNGYGSAFVEHWNGTSWVAVSIPTPLQMYLDAIACASPTFCMAVGRADDGTSTGRTVPIILRWNGTSWTKNTVPNPSTSTASAQLVSVSCPTETTCMAVGSYNSSHNFLVERWNGSTWTVSAGPQPVTTPYASLLTGVSCATATQCLAVGEKASDDGTNKSDGGYAQKWDGSSWISVPSSGTKAQSASLTSVACPTSLICVAGGGYSYGNLATTLAYAERYAP